MRADLFLVDCGMATTRSQAQRLIASGVQWRADLDSAWRKVAKNGDEIPEGAELVVPDTTEAKYISRGGLKLEGALQSTGLKVAGWRCLDVGQSTGGFTDCLLQQGAAQVVGVDAISLDTSAPMRWAAKNLPGAIQGNLDPIVLIAGGAALDKAVDDILEATRGKPHIFNLGHGILPETPITHVEQLLKRIRQGSTA